MAKLEALINPLWRGVRRYNQDADNNQAQPKGKNIFSGKYPIE
jgi:hypothetical protein